MVVGLGVDIVEIERIEHALEIHGQRFLDRLLTPAEQAYWSAHGKSRATLAGLWAAKEAAAKALGTGFVAFGLTDIEISHDQHGCPQVSLFSGAMQAADNKRVDNVLISISHSRLYAVAQAIALTKC